LACNRFVYFLLDNPFILTMYFVSFLMYEYISNLLCELLVVQNFDE